MDFSDAAAPPKHELLATLWSRNWAIITCWHARRESKGMDKVLKTIFGMIQIIFFAVSTVIVFIAAAIISLIVVIAAMIYAPFTFISKNANIGAMKPWIKAPFDSAIDNSLNSWKTLQKNLSKI
jgi:hypothetical protein